MSPTFETTGRPLSAANRIRSLFLGAAAALLLSGCTEEPKPWNVVLVTFDTTRADRIGAYGNDRIETPTLDRLAADGILFSHAVSVAPITAPSHSSILTGLYPTAHGFRDNGLFVLEDHQLTLAEMLRDQGYATAAAVGAFPVVSQFGFDQGFDLFDDHLTGMYEDYLGERAVPKEQLFFDERRAAQVNEAVLPWLEQRGDEPFFLWVHYFDPHQPFEPPPPYDQLYADDLYNGEIAYTDSRLGHLLDQLDRLGQLDRTLIVMTADHGEGLGEHNELTHAMLAYDSTLHVPLIIRPPAGAAPAGRVVDDRVGAVDIVPTVLDLLNLPQPENLHGSSMQPLWSDIGDGNRYTPQYYAENLSPRLTHGWGELRVLYDGPLKYIHGPRPELYDLTEDPKELDDLLAGRPDDAARMREELARFIQDHAADQPVETRALDPELVRRLQSLGYLHGSGEGGEQIREVLIDDGVPPQDRVTDLNRMSAAKHLLFDGRPSDALNYTEKLIATGGGSPMYLELHAAALAGVGRIDEAWDAARQLMEVRNVSDQLAVYLASRRFQGGQRDEAIAFLAELSDRQATARTLHVLAGMHRQNGDLDQALARLDQAIELQDDFAPARVDRAVHFARAGEVRRAEQEFLAALDRDPYYPKGHFNYGAFLVENERLAEAIPLFDRAVALAPRYLNARAAQVTANALAGDLDAARAALAPLEQMAPEAPEVIELAEWIDSL